MRDGGRCTLILGGARSGKSRYAESLAEGWAKVVFVATAEALDDDMSARIARHRADRPAHWTTVEAPLNLSEAIRGAPADATIIVDCLTLWISNLMFSRDIEDDDAFDVAAKGEVASWLAAARARQGNLIVVTNEVGLGIVPDNAVSRRYRDVLGRVNQQVAAAADDVILLVAGLPVVVKQS
ncbi:MAG: bifunctional adenosylcobinamide kinase/adenosylcobinamide-phosphate guanylyltransferase [bacterium]